jgi:hypothetical protein
MQRADSFVVRVERDASVDVGVITGGSIIATIFSRTWTAGDLICPLKPPN